MDERTHFWTLTAVKTLFVTRTTLYVTIPRKGTGLKVLAYSITEGVGADMVSSPTDIDRIVDESLPPDFQRGLLELIYSSYEATELRLASEFDSPQVHDLRGHYRRAAIEKSLLELCSRFQQIQASSELNSTQNSYHVLVETPGLVLTVSAVETPHTMVRTALFRQTYSYQMGFWDDGKIPNTTDRLYGIVLHGPADNDHNRVGFVVLAFPNSTCSQYIERIDLRQRFYDLDRDLLAAREEIISEEPAIKLIPSLMRKAD